MSGIVHCIENALRGMTWRPYGLRSVETHPWRPSRRQSEEPSVECELMRPDDGVGGPPSVRIGRPMTKCELTITSLTSVFRSDPPSQD